MPKTLDDIQSFHEKLKFRPGQVVGNHQSYMNGLQLFTNQFAYVVSVAEGMLKANKNFDKVLGYKPEEINILFLYTLYHPEEKDLMSEFVTQAIKYLLEHPSYPLTGEASITYSIRKADGTYIRVLRQTATLESDNQGKTISTISICTDISFLKMDGSVSFHLNYPNHPPFNLNYNNREPEINLSNRELEIIKLIAQGKDSKKIAELLSISVHTVRTHRKNMLNKSKFQSMIQLVNYAIKNSLT